MKKISAIVIPLVLIFALGFTYYWYKKNPPRVRLSKAGEMCYEKCRNILRENFKRCGDGCYTGAPIFAYDKSKGKCISRVNLYNKNLYDFYVNDCNTNKFISRWNPTQEELAKLTNEQITGMADEIMTYQSNILNDLVDLGSNEVEGGLIGR